MIDLDLSDQIAALRQTFSDIRAVVGVDKLSMKFFNFTGPLDIPQPEDNFYYRLSPIPPPTATSTVTA